MKCPVEMDQNYINYLKIPVCFDSYCFGSLCAYFIIYSSHIKLNPNIGYLCPLRGSTMLIVTMQVL